MDMSLLPLEHIEAEMRRRRQSEAVRLRDGFARI